jgi:hypothetical protein
MKADVELSDLDFLSTGPKAWSTSIMARCNGLLDVFDDASVKFMHRSIPEFLQKSFSRNQEFHGLNDYKVTVAMAWAYLVEVKYVAAQTSSDQATDRSRAAILLDHPSRIAIQGSVRNLNLAEMTKTSLADLTAALWKVLLITLSMSQLAAFVGLVLLTVGPLMVR